MKLIGLTGGIGSGKTTVANVFKSFGIPIYIADDEAKRLMLISPCKEEISALLGTESYNAEGNLNRKYIASKVFTSKKLLDQLNQIVHPRVAIDFQNWAQKQDAPYVIYEAAILFETGKYKDFNYTILVTAPLEDRIKRLKIRDNATEEDILNRINNQWTDERKSKLANWIIKNEDLVNTKTKICKLHEFISNL